VLAAQTVGVILNREPAGSVDALVTAFAEVLASTTGVALPGYSTPLLNGGGSGALRARGMLLACWAGKGLGLRGHGRGAVASTAALLDALEGGEEEVLSFAASGLGTLVGEGGPGQPLSGGSGVYKQRAYGAAAGRYAAARESEGCTRLLLGVCCMAPCLPSALRGSEMERLVPVTVLALEHITTGAPLPPHLADAVASSALHTFRALLTLPSGPPSFGVHLHTVVPALLALGGVARGHKPAVRALALDCLRDCVGPPPGATTGTLFTYAKLHPLRAAVTAGLGPALDDPRRAVRRRAAAARNDWYTMR
jgi:hypothetical protein